MLTPTVDAAVLSSPTSMISINMIGLTAKQVQLQQYCGPAVPNVLHMLPAAAGVACMLYSRTSVPSFKHAYAWHIHFDVSNCKTIVRSKIIAVCHCCAMLHRTACQFTSRSLQKACKHDLCLATADANVSDYFFECFCSSARSCCEKLSLTLVSSQSASQSSALAGSSSSSRHSVTRETSL